jgi:hypothetical protein
VSLSSDKRVDVKSHRCVRARRPRTQACRGRAAMPRRRRTKPAAHPGVLPLGARHAVPQHSRTTTGLLRQTFILSIDLIVFAPDARSRRSTALRFAAAGVLSQGVQTCCSRSASGRMCAICRPRACSRSFRSSESPVSALEMEVFRSVQREGSTSGFTTERPSAEPGRQTGTGRTFVSVHSVRQYCTTNHRRSAFPSLIHGCGSISHGRATRCRRAG